MRAPPQRRAWSAALKAGRSLSLALLRPFQYLLDAALFVSGVALLIRFGLDVYPSPSWDALGWVIQFHRFTDPVLSGMRTVLSQVIPISASGAKALPLGASIVVWLVRYSVVWRIKKLRMRLEEATPASLFGGKKKSDRGAGVADSRPPTASAIRDVAVLSAAALPAPQRIGRYEVLEELGRGAMGAVYKAMDTQIGRVVALKVILTRDLSPEELMVYKERFYREARAAGKMSHPGIITVHDIAEDASGTPYLVMEYVEGQTLDRVAAEHDGERLDVSQCLAIALQLAEALDYAHRHGVVHRDIKPANVLITPTGQAKIADFGVAKLIGTQYTQAGQVIGTPAFMAPEQLTGNSVDARSDIFSFGVVLYWMLTGEKPFSGDTITAITYKVVHTTPLPAKQLNPALPPDLDAVLVRCLSKSASERYQSAAELIADLQALRTGRPIASPQPAA